MPECPHGETWDPVTKKCVSSEITPTPPTPTPVIPTVGGLPVPVSKVTTSGVLGKICGEANEVVFAGLTDLFQMIVDHYIPNVWPLTELEEMFNDTFDDLQENLKPYAYNQGVAMGDRIEGQVEAWIKSKFDAATADIEALRDQALGEINAAKNELLAHAEKIQNLLERVGKLEGATPSIFGEIGGMFQ